MSSGKFEALQKQFYFMTNSSGSFDLDRSKLSLVLLRASGRKDGLAITTAWSAKFCRWQSAGPIDIIAIVLLFYTIGWQSIAYRVQYFNAIFILEFSILMLSSCLISVLYCYFKFISEFSTLIL